MCSARFKLDQANCADLSMRGRWKTHKQYKASATSNLASGLKMICRITFAPTSLVSPVPKASRPLGFPRDRASRRISIRSVPARGIQIGVTTLCAVLVFAPSGVGQTAISHEIRPGAFIRALRIDQVPRIDGLLDDDCWQRAEPLANFTQVLPVEGAAASERAGRRRASTS